MRNFRLGPNLDDSLLEYPTDDTLLPRGQENDFLKRHTIIVRRDEGLLTLKNHMVLGEISPIILMPLGGFWLMCSWVLLLFVLIPFPQQYHTQYEMTLAATISFGIGFMLIIAASRSIAKYQREYDAGYPGTFTKEKLN